MSFAKFFAALGFAAVMASAQATVVTFDDVSIDDWSGSTYGSYGGASSWVGGHLLSRDNAIFGTWGQFLRGLEIAVTFDSPIVFDGTQYVGEGTLGFSSYQLYYEGDLVYEGPALGGAGHSYVNIWLASGYSGPVDKVVLMGMYDGIEINNFTYHAAPVPEPESMAMLLSGLGLMGMIARRRTRYLSR